MSTSDFILGFAIIDYLIVVSMICFQAVYFNRMVNREKLVENNTYLTSLFIVFFNCAAFMMVDLSEVIIANSFVVLSLGQLFKIYNEKYKMAQVFNASLLMGIATVIYPPNIIGLLLIFLLIFYLTTPIWRDVFVLLLGYLLPMVYVMVYHFFMGGIDELGAGILERIDVGVRATELIPGALLFLVIVAVMSLAASLSFMKAIASGVVKVRKLLWTVVIVGLFGCSTYLLNGGNLMKLLVTLTLPLSILMANFFERLRHQWMAEVFFLVLVAGLGWFYFS